ncbi:MAG: molybdopterin-dependent oxidoreductase [Acidobacteria bacterium]|nr:molybdopterin-dependent oxidoreductase [Acidobacteriota bacterium]
MKLDRRRFLFLSGGVATGAATGRLSLKAIGAFNEALAPEMGAFPGDEKFADSICRMCPGGCGVRVRTVGDRPVKIDGNPLYPVNRSGVCPRGQALLQWLYHPDRVMRPQIRNGEKGWESVSWDKALQLMAAKLDKVSSAKQKRVVAVSGRGAGLTRKLFARFLHASGANMLFSLPTGMETSEHALQLMAGRTNGGSERMAYDLENSSCVLNFGCDLLEGWGTPAHTLRVFGQWRDTNRAKRTTLIHFDSKLSISAARADQWVPTRPGTLGTAALGIAFVLLSENLYDGEFVDDNVFGFNDWTDTAGRSHVGFRTLVREEYRLSRVSELTGIPPATLVKIAREFAAGRGAVAIGPTQSPGQPGKLSDAMAIHSLNALVGNIGARGGVALVPTDGWELPADARGTEVTLSSSMEALETSLAGSPEVLILDQAESLLDLLSAAQREKLRQIPFVVTITTLQDSTTSYATLILPDCTSLESWVDGQAPTAYPHEVLSISEPVIAPRGESKPFGDTLLSLAKIMGGSITAALPWKDLPEVLQASSRRVAQNKRGYLFGTEVDEHWQRLLERGGWWTSDWTSEEQFWTGIKENGGWWDPVSWAAEPQRSFPTPSGRFELYSHRLEEWLRQQGKGAFSGTVRDWDRQVLPHSDEVLVSADSERFPLLLHPSDQLPFFGNNGQEIAYLQQISSLYGGMEWQRWVELSPEDSHERGIESGDLVWVESAVGKVRRVALVVEGSTPGTVIAPRTGNPTTGRWAVHGEQRLADILVPVLDPVLKTRSSMATYVNIYKA